MRIDDLFIKTFRDNLRVFLRHFQIILYQLLLSHSSKPPFCDKKIMNPE